MGKDLLDGIPDAFAEYVQSEKDVNLIRSSISRYILSQVEQINREPLYSIPKHVTGIYRDYLESVIRHKNAKERYDSVSEDIIDAKENPKSCIDEYLDVLQLRQQNKKLQTIQHYVSEASAIIKEQEVDRVTPSSEPNLAGLEGMIENVKVLTRKLELAVIQARHQLLQGKALLQSVSENRPSTDEDQLRALNATRKELTTWLEDTLTKCKTETEEHPNKVESTQISEIQDQYEKYLDERKGLLQVMREIPIELHEEVPKPQLNQRVDPISILSVIDRSIGPLMQKQMDQQNRYASAMFEQDLKRTDDILCRLADESQLLAAYPKPESLGPQDSIFQHINSWIFAGNSAEENMIETIGIHTKQGHEALINTENYIQKLNSIRLA